MNDIFTKLKENKVVLDEKYSLQPDGYNGLVLVFEEKRERKKLDSKTKKETGETEEYIFTDKWYYPKISQSLNKYLQLVTSESKNIEELKNIVLRVEEKVDDIKENW